MLKSSNIRIMLHFGVRRFSVTRKSLGLERQTKATERVLIINRRNILKCTKFILFVTAFLLETIFYLIFCMCLLQHHICGNPILLTSCRYVDISKMFPDNPKIWSCSTLSTILQKRFIMFCIAVYPWRKTKSFPVLTHSPL